MEHLTISKSGHERVMANRTMATPYKGGQELAADLHIFFPKRKLLHSYRVGYPD